MAVKLLTPALLLAIVIGGLQWSTRNRGSEWKVGTATFQSSGDHLLVSVPIENFGPLDLHIDKIQAGCTCTNASIANPITRPGKTAEILLEVDLNSLPNAGAESKALEDGVRTFEITARVRGDFASGLPAGYLELRVPCRVELPISIPEPVRFDSLDLAKSHSAQQLTLRLRKGFQHCTVETNVPGITIQPVAKTAEVDATQNDEWRDITFNTNFDHQSFLEHARGRTQVYTNLQIEVAESIGGSQRNLRIPITISTQPLLTMQPSHIRMGPAMPGEMVHRTATITAADSVARFEVLSHKDSESVVSSLKTVNSGSGVSNLEISAAADVAGTHLLRMIARTTLTSGETLDVPLYGTLHVRKGLP